MQRPGPGRPTQSSSPSSDTRNCGLAACGPVKQGQCHAAPRQPAPWFSYNPSERPHPGLSPDHEHSRAEGTSPKATRMPRVCLDVGRLQLNFVKPSERPQPEGPAKHTRTPATEAVALKMQFEAAKRGGTMFPRYDSVTGDRKHI